MVKPLNRCNRRHVPILGSLPSLFLSQSSFIQRVTAFSPYHSSGFRHSSNDRVNSVNRMQPTVISSENESKNRKSISPKSTISRHKRGPSGRPRHSYLKLMLDPPFWDELHRKTLLVRDECQTAFGTTSLVKQGLVGNELTQPIHSTNVISMQRDDDASKRMLIHNVKPRSKQSLHLTFFFGGQVLCALPTEELIKWHTEIKGRVQQISPSTVDAYTLTFQRLRLFPPKRNSLIVAEFNVSPSLHRLYEDVVDIALSSETTNNMLAQVVGRKQERFLAHVTLADIPRSWGKSELEQLGLVLQQQKSDMHALVNGLTMGGPRPQQTNLDWDFYFPAVRDKEG